MVACLTRFDGCHVDEQAARAHGVGHIAVEQHVFHHTAAFQHADDDVRIDHCGSGVRVDDCAMAGQALCFLGCAIPDVHFVSGFAQAPGHGEAHEAYAHNCNFHS
jgi:hypothetical protein